MRPAALLVFLGALVGLALLVRSVGREPPSPVTASPSAGASPDRVPPDGAAEIARPADLGSPRADGHPPARSAIDEPPDGERTPEPLAPGGLRVRVLDAAGRPAGGIAVTLRSHVGGARGDRKGQTTTRASDGWARLEIDALDELRVIAEAANIGITFSVAAEVASATPVRAELAGWPREGDELELRLPTMGAVRARVLTHDGAPMAGEARVSWAWVPAEVAAADPRCAYDRVPGPSMETRTGTATIAPVGAGLALELSVSAPGFAPAVTRGVAGPRAAGEVVDVELRLGPPLGTVALRVLDAAGEPLARTKLRCELWLDPDLVPHPASGPPRPERLTLETDEEGRVRIELPPYARTVAPRLDLVRRSVDRAAQDDPDWTCARIELPLVLAEGERVELGDARLAAVPLLAEGRVVDEAGEPVARAALQFLERFGPAPEHGWLPVRDGRCTVRSDGGFSVRSDRAPRALAVEVTAPAFAARVFEDLAPGARGLELVLAREAPAPPRGGLRVRVELEPAISPLALRLELRSPQGSDSPDWWSNTVLELEWLTPGRYDVWVETREGGLELARVADVEVRAGETTEDPRLLPLDLRGLARRVTLEILRPDGTPWRRREVRVDPLEPRSAFRVTTDDEGRATLVLPVRITQLEAAIGTIAERVTLLPGREGTVPVVIAGE